MPPNYRGVRLIDTDGNYYVFECPMDVNAGSVEDILLSTDQGITKLVGYKLAIDGIYKNMEDQTIEPQSKYNFYKKINIFDEGQTVSQEEFGKTMTDLIAKAKVSKIGKVKIKSWKGEPVFEDTRGYFLKRLIDCAAQECPNKVEGVIRLSTDTEGEITRGQNFVPNEKGAQRTRPGSKLWLCPSCSVKSIPVEQSLLDKVKSLKEVPEDMHGFELADTPVPPKTSTNVSLSKREKVLSKLEELSDSSSQVSAEYLKGYLAASLELLKEG